MLKNYIWLLIDINREKFKIKVFSFVGGSWHIYFNKDVHMFNYKLFKFWSERQESFPLRWFHRRCLACICPEVSLLWRQTWTLYRYEDKIKLSVNQCNIKYAVSVLKLLILWVSNQKYNQISIMAVMHIKKTLKVVGIKYVLAFLIVCISLNQQAAWYSTASVCEYVPLVFEHIKW